jgi:hypothetical protein
MLGSGRAQIGVNLSLSASRRVLGAGWPSGSLFGLQLPDRLQRVVDVLTDVGH